ncbi:alpha/beta fold hydrolase [Holdemania massiliensis]
MNKAVKKGMIGLMLMAVVLGGCQKASEPKQTDEPGTEVTDKVTGSREVIAKAYVETLGAGDFEKLLKGFAYDEQMQKAAAQLQASLEPSLKQLGALKEIQKANEIEQGAYKIVQVPVLFENQNLSVNVVFNDQDQIAGVNFSEYVEPSDVAALTLPEGAREQELTITMRDGKDLPATLTLPNKEQPVPVIILVHGSGPNDRNETIYGNTVFKDIAYRLAEQGIATLRYDKRTYVYGADCAADIQLTVDQETVHDAVDIVEFMAGQPEVDSAAIYVLGHSLGGLCIPRIAAETPQAAGYIMMAAPVTDLASLMRFQYAHLAQFMNTDQEKAAVDAALAELDKLNQLDQLADDELVAGAYPAYWKDLLAYDPVKTAEAITKPVLVLQGEEDYQVPLQEYETWKAAYGERSNWTFHSYPGLSHLMMPGDFDVNPNTYYMQKAIVDEQVTKDIAAFIATEPTH